MAGCWCEAGGGWLVAGRGWRVVDSGRRVAGCGSRVPGMRIEEHVPVSYHGVVAGSHQITYPIKDLRIRSLRFKDNAASHVISLITSN